MKFYDEQTQTWKDVQIKVANAIQNEYGESNNDGYSQEYLNDHLVNVSNEVDEDYRVNFLKGKNLWNYNSYNTNYGVSSTYNGSTLLLNGTATAETYNNNDNNMVHLKAGVYTFRIKKESGSVSGNQAIRLRNTTNSTSILNTTLDPTSGHTITFTLNKSAWLSLSIYYFSGNVFTNLKLNIQIEKGSTATTYEDYITPSIYVDNNEIYNSSEFPFFYKKLVKPSDSANFNFLLDNGTMGTIYINELGTTKYYVGTFNKVSGQNPVFNMIGNNGITITGSNASGTVVLGGATTNSNLRVCIIGCQMNFPI